MSSVYDLEMSCDRYTYADYEEWDEWFRCELIDGIVYMMSSPSVWHQDVVLEIGARLRESLNGRKCKAYVSPLDVRLFPKNDGSDRDVVQPDVIVVCDESKMSDGKACRGAPDVVIEVISGSTKFNDLRMKRDLYKSAGVKEYWVIAKAYAIRWVWVDGKDEELRFMRVNGVIRMQLTVLPLCIELDA